MKRVTLLGEVLMRMDVPNSVSTFNGHDFKVYYGGSEANVACGLAEKGIKTTLLTKVPNNYIGLSIIKHFKSNDVLFSDDTLTSEGRVGIYYTQPGFGSRFADVVYDRANSSFTESLFQIKDVDFDNMDVFHVSGVSAALSHDMQNLIIEIASECQKRNIKVSYDSNYRSKLWSQKQAGEFLKKILPYTNILFAGRLDFFHLLNLEEKFDDNEMINIIRNKYDNLDIISYTLRTVITNSRHKLIGYFNTKDEMIKSDVIEFDVLDRIGGGDNFTANVLYGYLNDLDYTQLINDAITYSSIQHTFTGDFTSTNNKKWTSLGLTGVDR